MNLVADQRTEAPVNQLMTRDGPLACKFGGDDHGLEMGAIIAAHFNFRIVESCCDKLTYLVGVHCDYMLRNDSGREVYREYEGLPNAM